MATGGLNWASIGPADPTWVIASFDKTSIDFSQIAMISQAFSDPHADAARLGRPDIGAG